MARVAQIGAAETHAAYNRALVKAHVPVKLANVSPEDFELGGADPQPIEAVMLKTELQITGSARCIATECAMWRWERTTRTHGFCGLAPMHGATRAQS